MARGTGYSNTPLGLLLWAGCGRVVDAARSGVVDKLGAGAVVGDNIWIVEVDKVGAIEVDTPVSCVEYT